MAGKISRVIVGMLVLALFAYLAYLVRPLFQWTIVNIFFVNFWFWVLCLPLLALATWLARVRFRGSGQSKAERRKAVVRIRLLWFATLAPLIIVFAVFSGAWTSTRMLNDISFATKSGVADTSLVRYMPYEVAFSYANSKQDDPTKRVGEMHAVQVGDDLLWIAPLTPNGMVNYFSDKQSGVVTVDSDGNVTVIKNTFQKAEHIGITDNLQWSFAGLHFLSRVPEVYYLPAGAEVLGIAPYVSFRLSFPVTVPYWGGVFVIHDDGSIEDLTPEQAMADPRLAGARLFPEVLARRYSEAYAYKNGIANVWFKHQDQPVIPEIAGPNQMPYLLPTTDGQKWVTLTEPYGPSQAVFKVLTIDAHTGKAEVSDLSKDNLIGPQKAYDFAKTRLTGYVWRDSEGGTYLLIEPRPIVRSGKLFWLYNITTFEYAGGGLFVVVDASTASVVSFSDRASFDLWLRTGALATEPDTETSRQELLDRIQKALDELQGLIKELEGTK